MLERESFVVWYLGKVQRRMEFTAEVLRRKVMGGTSVEFPRSFKQLVSYSLRSRLRCRLSCQTQDMYAIAASASFHVAKSNYPCARNAAFSLRRPGRPQRNARVRDSHPRQGVTMD